MVYFACFTIYLILTRRQLCKIVEKQRLLVIRNIISVIEIKEEFFLQ